MNDTETAINQESDSLSVREVVHTFVVEKDQSLYRFEIISLSSDGDQFDVNAYKRNETGIWKKMTDFPASPHSSPKGVMAKAKGWLMKYSD